VNYHQDPHYNPLLIAAPAASPLQAIDGRLDTLAFRGSIAHNMFVPKNDPNSIDDVDLIGIVMPEKRVLLRLEEWGSRGTKGVQRAHWDIVLYGVRKAVAMLLQGNPNILTLLWVRPEHYVQLGETMRPLIENRRLFAGKHVWKPWAGYASEQLLIPRPTIFLDTDLKEGESACPRASKRSRGPWQGPLVGQAQDGGRS
jgi:hypothetical protein